MQTNQEGYDNVVDSWSVGVIVFSMYVVIRSLLQWRTSDSDFSCFVGSLMLARSSRMTLSGICGFVLLIGRSIGNALSTKEYLLKVRRISHPLTFLFN